MSLPLSIFLVSPVITQPADTLTKVDVNATVINKNILHLVVSLLTILLILELDEGILQTVSRLLVAYDLAREDFAES